MEKIKEGKRKERYGEVNREESDIQQTTNKHCQEYISVPKVQSNIKPTRHATHVCKRLVEYFFSTDKYCKMSIIIEIH